MAKKPFKMSTKKPIVKELEEGPSRDDIISAAKGSEEKSKPQKKASVAPSGPGRVSDGILRKMKGITFPSDLVGSFQKVAAKKTAGDFSGLLDMVYQEFLESPDSFPLKEESGFEGERKNKFTSLPIDTVESIQEQASVFTRNNFSSLTQKIVRGYLNKPEIKELLSRSEEK